jgi:hypothetical protein
MAELLFHFRAEKVRTEDSNATLDVGNVTPVHKPSLAL